MVHLKSITHKPALLGVVCFCSLFNVTATDVKPDELAGKALQKKRTTITSFSNMLPDAFASHIHSHHFQNAKQNAQRHLQFFLSSGAVCGHDLLCRFVGGFQWMIFRTRGCVVAVLLVATLLLPTTPATTHPPKALKTPDLQISKDN